MIELYHDWDSLMSFKVRACLAEKKLNWKSHRVILRQFEHLQPEYLALNPNGVVPTLVHFGRIVLESSMINEYLDEVFPTPALKPVQPIERAHMRAWVKFGDDVMHHAVRPATFQLMIRQGLQKLTPDQLEERIRNHPMPERAAAFRVLANGDIDYDKVMQSVGQLRDIVARMEKDLSRQPWLAGATYSLADVAAMAFVDRVEHLGMPFIWQDSPGVQDWVERLKSRPAFQEAAPADNLRLPAPTEQSIERIRELAA